MDKIKIGILGLGNVGRGTYRILTGNADNISHKAGADLEVAKVLVRDAGKDRGLNIDPSLLTTEPGDIIDNKEIDIVVELLGGIQPALDFCIRAMKNGKSIVTANKDMMALHGKELLETAEECRVDILFEGSVAGGIPIIMPLKQCLAANRIQEVMGIINGTTNYILTKMTEEKCDFLDVLKDAQQLGYAEADPSADVDGHDAARKLSILASIAFNTRVTVNDVFVEGIRNIDAQDISYGRELNYQVKLLGIARDTPEGVEARVHPCFIPKNHPLASVNDVFNAVFVRGDAVGETMFYGRGAGEMPTGSAVVGDIISAARNRQRHISGLNCTCYENKPLKPMGLIQCKYYIRLAVFDRPGVLASIAYAFGDKNVSLATVLQKHTDGDMAEIVLVTHRVLEQDLQNALKLVKQLSSVDKICSLIRVEGEY